jgi:chromatin structure-remodeling complex subunit RSC1/2
MANHQPNGYTADRPSSINIAAANNQIPLQPTPLAQPLNTPSSFNQGHTGHYHPSSASPALGHQSLQRSSTFAGTGTPQSFSQSRNQQYATPSHPQQLHTSANNQQHRGPTQAPAASYKAPSPVEVWHLPDAANASIPPDVRSQFHTDAQGRVLFFTAPPVPPPEVKEKRLTHSPGYLAFRARQIRERREQTAKRPAEEEAVATVGAEKGGIEPKRIRKEVDNSSTDSTIEKAMSYMNNMLADATLASFKAMYGEDDWEDALKTHLNIVADAQEEARRKVKEREKLLAERSKRGEKVTGPRGLTSLLDYKPPNEALEWRR